MRINTIHANISHFLYSVLAKKTIYVSHNIRFRINTMYLVLLSENYQHVKRFSGLYYFTPLDDGLKTLQLEFRC